MRRLELVLKAVALDGAHTGDHHSRAADASGDASHGKRARTSAGDETEGAKDAGAEAEERPRAPRYEIADIEAAAPHVQRSKREERRRAVEDDFMKWGSQLAYDIEQYTRRRAADPEERKRDLRSGKYRHLYLSGQHRDPPLGESSSSDAKPPLA